MTNENKLDELKNKITNLGEDLKYKVNEAQLQGDKTVDDLKHKVAEIKLESEKALHNLNKETNAKYTEGKVSFDEKVNHAKAETPETGNKVQDKLTI